MGVRAHPSRLWIVVAMLSACGRIGFEPGSPGIEDGPADFRVFGGLCTLERITIISNGLAIDDATATQLQTSLAGGCNNTPVVSTVSQDDPGILDPGSDRPLIPSDQLVIIGGGDGPNRALAYMLRTGSTPIVWDSSAEFRERSTDRVIASGPFSGTHDYALLMVIVEPSGLRVLSGLGRTSQGTAAAALWFSKVIAPDIASNDNVWSLVEWDDDDGTPGATDNDTFVEIESGGS